MKHPLFKEARARTRIQWNGEVLTAARLAPDPDYLDLELGRQAQAPEWEQAVRLELAEIGDD